MWSSRECRYRIYYAGPPQRWTVRPAQCVDEQSRGPEPDSTSSSPQTHRTATQAARHQVRLDAVFVNGAVRSPADDTSSRRERSCHNIKHQQQSQGHDGGEGKLKGQLRKTLSTNHHHLRCPSFSNRQPPKGQRTDEKSNAENQQKLRWECL